MINGGASHRTEGGRGESALNAVSSADNVLNGRTIGAASAAIAAECAVRALIQQMKGGNNTVSNDATLRQSTINVILNFRDSTICRLVLFMGQNLLVKIRV